MITRLLAAARHIARPDPDLTRLHTRHRQLDALARTTTRVATTKEATS